jgi:hypothetical protein
MMPMTFARSGPSLKYLPLCDVCGGFALFGFDVRLGLAIDRKDAKLGGQWFCSEHQPKGSLDMGQREAS